MGHLAKVLKALPDKTSGPDAVSAQLLRTAPPLFLAPLLKLIHEMENQAQLPTQLQMRMVVTLPKNIAIERPIASTSVLYRVWRRLRKPLLDQWQKNLPRHMDQVRKANVQHGVTVLMDASTFYDTIQLNRLQSILVAIPTTHAGDGHAGLYGTQGHSGGTRDDSFLPRQQWSASWLSPGTLLAPALTPWKTQHPQVHLSSWVDDVGFDAAGTSPHQVATQAV